MSVDTTETLMKGTHETMMSVTPIKTAKMGDAMNDDIK